MTNSGPHGCRPCAMRRKRNPAGQGGQALIYGMFVLIGGVAGLFFLFNAGQLVREKTKLVNTADAVAYSAGVMNARALNFQAYGNRAMVANSVAIGQLVSLSSWAAYADTLGAVGGFTALQPKFSPFFASYYAAANAGSYLQSLNNGTLEQMARASDGIVHNLLKQSQDAVYRGLLPARATVMDEVAQANYTGDGQVVVDNVSLLETDYGDFVANYSGAKRSRFKEVVVTAIDKDLFVPARSWTLPAIPFLPSQCPGANARGQVDWFFRRGGTALLGFDEWRALDTLSEKKWVPRNKLDLPCSVLVENPTGWGGRSAGEAASGESDWAHYDYAKIVNPATAGLATLSSEAWDYRGLPAFHDLANNVLQQSDPRLKLAVRVRRERAQTLTSEGRSDVRSGPRLNAYRAMLKQGDDLVAVSASEAFFERNAANRDNVHGVGIGRPMEIGSLFNPFWHVRLIHSPEGIDRAQADKGVSLRSAAR